MEMAMSVRGADYICPEDRQKFTDAILAAIEQGDERACEIRIEGLPGRPGSVFMLVSMRAIAKSGDRVLLYAAVTDVTAQRESEGRERDTASRLRELMHEAREDTAEPEKRLNALLDGMSSVMGEQEAPPG